MIKISHSPDLKPLPSHDKLGFGKYFTDHLFKAHYAEGRGWYDAQIMPYQNFAMDPAASVFHYGQALFEGMKAFRYKKNSIALFQPEFNFERMQAGAERLCLVSPPKELFMESVRELVKVDERWIPEQDHCALYIRPTLIGTEGFLGVRPSKEMIFFIILSPVGSYYSGGLKPVKIWVEDQAVRAAPGGLGATKAGANYAASLKSALEAKERGYDQVLWLDSNHSAIEEVGTMNVFFVLKGKKVVTPKLNGSILAGGVRSAIITLLQDMSYQVEERQILINELVEKEKSGELLEAFGTGTAAVVTPIGELKYKNDAFFVRKDSGALSTELYSTISEIQRGLKPDPHGWVQIIK